MNRRMKNMMISSLKPEAQHQLLEVVLRKDFKSFVIKVFKEVSPNSKYLDNWHIDVICNELMKVTNDESDVNRLIINIPPRYMKSIICSVAFPAYILGHNPKSDIICVSYADELASKFALDCKRVLETAWYKEIFPGTKIAKDKKAINDFTTTRGGGRYATSVNGTLTGRGADYIIIDDPIKPADSFSDVIREKTNQWYGNTLYSRLNDKNKGKIIVIMQRLHDEDFTGYLLNTDSSFRHVKIQAIAEDDEKWIIRDPVMNKKMIKQRIKGEVLHPAREDLDRLNTMRKSMGEFNFSGQYQQNPAPREGAIIKRSWLHFYDPADLENSIRAGLIKPSYVIQSWDTANKVEENNDYSACITALVDVNHKHYVLECYRAKLEFPSLIKKVREKYEAIKGKYRCSTQVYIEDKGSGTQLIQTLRKEQRIYPKAIKPDYDKATRLLSISHLLENGSCLFPNNTPHWWSDFENELLRFPKGKHDDQCDALSQMLGNQPKPEPRVRWIA
jgi:predicted phage terminase large subunit-like protein